MNHKMTAYRTNRALLVMVGLVFWVLIAPLSRAQTPSATSEAESFMAAVLSEANEALKLEDREAQREAIDRLVDRHVDMRRTGRFTLGQYARQMTQDQAARFYPLFDSYATLIYQDILSEYSDEALTVTGAIQRSPRDTIVKSKVVGARPGSQYGDTIVYWRLFKEPGGFKVVDAGANNLWLGIEQRSQFTSVIANNGGGQAGIDALLDQMEKRVNQRQ